MPTHLIEALDERLIPQSEPYRDDQVPNSAGGYTWKVDEWTHLRRFLILGSEGGTYYIGERDLTKEGLKTIEKCLVSDPVTTISTIVGISKLGLAPKNDYALFALAVAAANENEETRKLALANLNSVARIGTHLFQFAEYLNALGSLSGRAKRRALAKWYSDREASQVAYQAIKYRQRNGWTHRDILRIAHPGSRVSSGNPTVPLSEDHKAIFDWISGRKTDSIWPSDLSLIHGFEAVQRATTKKEVANIIREYNLPREAVPTEYLSEPETWKALLDVGMPITALIRNLGNMTRLGVLTSVADRTQTVVDDLSNEELLQRGRVHPINILFALKTYASGQGFRGTNNWKPIQTIVDALDSAFYKSFKFVEPTGKRIMIALDVSASMSMLIYGTNLRCSEATAALSLVTANVEKRYEILGFAHVIRDLGISPKMRLDTVVKSISGLTFGGTDCALPMIHANRNNLEFDAFVVLTDNETWYGQTHPAAALKKYRKDSGIEEAKLVVVGMAANKFSIADPKDPRMLDVVGFDTSTPQVLSNFIAGKF